VLDIQRLRRGGGGLRKSLIFNDLCGLSCGSRICANCRDSVHHSHLALVLPVGVEIAVLASFALLPCGDVGEFGHFVLGVEFGVHVHVIKVSDFERIAREIFKKVLQAGTVPASAGQPPLGESPKAGVYSRF
jgi:hypothetical protein